MLSSKGLGLNELMLGEVQYYIENYHFTTIKAKVEIGETRRALLQLPADSSILPSLHALVSAGRQETEAESNLNSCSPQDQLQNLSVSTATKHLIMSRMQNVHFPLICNFDPCKYRLAEEVCSLSFDFAASTFLIWSRALVSNSEGAKKSNYVCL